MEFDTPKITNELKNYSYVKIYEQDQYNDLLSCNMELKVKWDHQEKRVEFEQRTENSLG